MYRILVTTGTWQSSYCAVQSLARKGHKVELLTDSPATPFIHSRFCSGHHLTVPETDEEAYIDQLLTLVKSERFDVLLPMSDLTVGILSRNRTLFEPAVKFLTCAEDLVDLSLNKARVAEFATGCGLAIPPTDLPGNLHTALQLISEKTGKIVLKTPYGTGNSGVFISDDQKLLKEWATERFNPSNLLIVQDFIEGDFYDMMTICRSGEIVEWFGFYTPIEYFGSGAPPIAYPCLEEDMYQYCVSFVQHLNWDGPLDFDFIRGLDGKLYLLEINPRLSGTTNFAYKLGIDLPGAYLKAIFGQDIVPAARNYSGQEMYLSVYPALARWLKVGRRDHVPKALRKLIKRNSVSSIYWDDWPVLYRVATRFFREVVA